MLIIAFLLEIGSCYPMRDEAPLPISTLFILSFKFRIFCKANPLIITNFFEIGL